jgi:uncharacterized protein (TIGR02145 family)
MKNKQNFSISPFLIIGLFLVFVSSCEKDDNVQGNSTNGKTTAVFNPAVTFGKMTDQDGNVYKTVTIGTQTWMAENLRTTKYNDGSDIPNITDNDEWEDLTTGAYCNYNNTSDEDTIATYGRLYNWYAVDTGKLCPTGWHVPKDTEWAELSTFLGGESVAGGKLKEIGTSHWQSHTTGATNETGFTALPGGGRTYSGTFGDVGYRGKWWSATESDAYGAYYWIIYDNYSFLNSSSYDKAVGFSVRCVRD